MSQRDDLRQSGPSVRAGHRRFEHATAGSLQVSKRIHYPLCHRRRNGRRENKKLRRSMRHPTQCQNDLKVFTFYRRAKSYSCPSAALAHLPLDNAI
ncbi:hypothetical protein PoB_002603400 [Plakobranchus ocellatus]|uniref:Uncharacterized protein n=1 Tax=Plakobranchus ocellatus TaxID=259542 RepID=A0AAV3ZYT6_9GAST|nr:hypothetical protein PoB_002603400 [Plakobranchus ocellatus]